MCGHRTTERQHPSLVQLIMVKHRKTSCSLPKLARNHSTMSLFSTFFSIDRYVFAKRSIILLSVHALQFISEKSVCGCHWKTWKIWYRSCLLKTIVLKLIYNITSAFSVLLLYTKRNYTICKTDLILVSCLKHLKQHIPIPLLCLRIGTGSSSNSPWLPFEKK